MAAECTPELFPLHTFVGVMGELLVTAKTVTNKSLSVWVELSKVTGLTLALEFVYSAAVQAYAHPCAPPFQNLFLRRFWSPDGPLFTPDHRNSEILTVLDP